MSGVPTAFVKSTSDVPGPGQAEFFWLDHPSGFGRMYVWRPAGTFVNANVLAVRHGGLWHNPGDDASAPSKLGLHDLCVALVSEGWVIVSFDYPPSPSNASPARDVSPPAFWPEPEIYCGWSTGFLRDNRDDTTRYGEVLWGPGNSINGLGIVVDGGSSGGTDALLAGATPDELWPKLAGSLALSYSRRAPRSSHRPNAIISGGAQPDWTQFHMPTDAQSGSLDPYHSDIHQHFMRQKGHERWSTLPIEIKRAASPWWWWQQGYPVNKTMPIYALWNEPTGEVDGANLTDLDWAPNTVLNDFAGGKAYTNPHHDFVTGAVEEAAQQFLHPASKVMGRFAQPLPVDPVQDQLDWLEELALYVPPAAGG